jgi:hypothetical protein
MNVKPIVQVMNSTKALKNMIEIIPDVAFFETARKSALWGLYVHEGSGQRI